MNDPVIESSSNVCFAPFNIGYPGLAAHAEAAGYTGASMPNKWELIFDFTQSASGVDNFTQIEPEDWQTELLEIPEYESREPAQLFFDYPERYGGTASDEPPATTPEVAQLESKPML